MDPPSLHRRRFKTTRLVTVTARERMILSLIRQAGELTRSELIQRADLPGAAVFRATEDLAARGLVTLGGTIARGPGKPSNLVSLNGDALATVGLSVMTDRAEAVLLDFAGVVRASRDVSVPGMDCDAVLDAVTRFIAEAAASSGIAHEAIFGIGIGLAGFFVDETGFVNPAAPLDSWALRDLAAIAHDKIGMDVTIENIANAAAVGERLLGAGRWANSFAYLNVAHGFGAGLILNGRLHRGRNGNAGEIAGMLDQFAALPVPNLESLRKALALRGVETRDVSDLVDRYRDDWPGISEWIAWAAPSFSFMVAMFHRSLDCDAIVLGGRLPPPLARRIVDTLASSSDRHPPRRGVGLPKPRLVVAELGMNATAVGAATIPLQAGYFE